MGRHKVHNTTGHYFIKSKCEWAAWLSLSTDTNCWSLCKLPSTFRRVHYADKHMATMVRSYPTDNDLEDVSRTEQKQFKKCTKRSTKRWRLQEQNFWNAAGPSRRRVSQLQDSTKPSRRRFRSKTEMRRSRCETNSFLHCFDRNGHFEQP